jgi:hypothetical protein
MGLTMQPPENILAQKYFFPILWIIVGKVTKNKLIVCVCLAMASTIYTLCSPIALIGLIG